MRAAINAAHRSARAAAITYRRARRNRAPLWRCVACPCRVSEHDRPGHAERCTRNRVPLANHFVLEAK